MKQVKTNAQNDRLKRDYLVYLKEAKQRSPATVEQVRHAIDRLEIYTGYKDFGSFNKEQALGFKRTLLDAKTKRTGKDVSRATVLHILQAVKDFLGWLHNQPGFRRRIDLADIAYLNLTTNEVRAAQAQRKRPYPSMEQIKAVLAVMPTATEVQRRDRAVVALVALTGVRDAALVSLKLKHINLVQRLLFQDARDVKTKFAKTIETWFFPVGEEIEKIVVEWVNELTGQKLYSPDDPLFPKTVIAQNSNRNFTVAGLGKEHWANATPVRQIFKEAFAAAGLPYFNPHSVRNTLVQLAYHRNLNLEQLEAWSKNLGHESMMTTLGSYGHIASERRQAIFDGLRGPQLTKSDDSIADQIADKVMQRLIGKL